VSLFPESRYGAQSTAVDRCKLVLTTPTATFELLMSLTEVNVSVLSGTHPPLAVHSQGANSGPEPGEG